MQLLDPQPALIDRAYEQLVEAIAGGALAPDQRIRQEELSRALGVSRQPISHALQLLKQQKLVEDILDGTKSAIEMAAIANATGLGVPGDGLGFPPCGVDDLPQILRGREAGGRLDYDGVVEVVSCLERDGRPRVSRPALGRLRHLEGTERIRPELL
ncbi:MAG TPA: GntR family transcriptional regulator [Stellaceae bacterium]|nr:GntR family transcriptional regulator [Stellaceae bacterium]